MLFPNLCEISTFSTTVNAGQMTYCPLNICVFPASTNFKFNFSLSLKKFQSKRIQPAASNALRPDNSKCPSMVFMFKYCIVFYKKNYHHFSINMTRLLIFK